MTIEEFYLDPIKILDSYLEEGREKVYSFPSAKSWNEENILKLYKQSLRIMYCLLSNTEGSKFKNNEFVVDISFVGSMGRILRDAYVSIIYLKTNTYKSEEMKYCWDYQIVNQKLQILTKSYLNSVEIDKGSSLESYINDSESEKQKLEELIRNINFDTKGQVLKGKEEKMIGLRNLVTPLGINYDKFENEFSYFSQFTHTTAFAISLVNNERISLGLLAELYRRIISYIVGITVETFQIFLPNYPQLNEAIKQYNELKYNNWS